MRTNHFGIYFRFEILIDKLLSLLIGLKAGECVFVSNFEFAKL